MTKLTRDEVAVEITAAFDRLFENLDEQAVEAGMVPSELAKLLDQESWGLGDDYREWFEQGDEEYV